MPTAPSNLKADVWKHFSFYNIHGRNELLDKSCVICKLSHAKIKHFGHTTNTSLINYNAAFFSRWTKLIITVKRKATQQVVYREDCSSFVVFLSD